MSIFKRMKDIIAANINDLLERFENPEHVIDQMIKEMEEAIIEVRKQTASVIASSKMTSKRISDVEKEVAKWQKNAELAIVEGQDELAKKALIRKREVSSQLELIKKQLEEEEAMVMKMKADLRLIEEKVQEARRKRETLLMKKRVSDAKKKMIESSEKTRAAFDGSAGSIINGFDSFAKYEEKIERELAESAAREELNADIRKTDLEAEFAHLNNHSQVDDELEALKKKLKSAK